MKHVIVGTETADGLIPYLNKNGIDMPVALNFPKAASISILKMLQFPERDSATGDLLYVVPGGRRVLAI